jgi:uncharacterized protein (TIGR00255 family)
MTGFARKQIQQQPIGFISWEVKTINGRYLDINFRLPETFRELEMTMRSIVSKYLKRGKVECVLHYQPSDALYEEIKVNKQGLKQFKSVVKEVNHTFEDNKLLMSLDVLDLLHYPGMMQKVQQDMSAAHEVILNLFETVLVELDRQRAREGEQLKQLLIERLEKISNQVKKAKQKMPEILEQQRASLMAKLQELPMQADENRLEQEMVYWAQKMDVSEELDRLLTHEKEVRRLLSYGDEIGRHLDFMMQELNREANTLASKSFSEVTTQIAVDIKVLVEQMREQVQNIE